MKRPQGWLKRQMDCAAEMVQSLPPWMRQEGEGNMPLIGILAGITTADLEAELQRRREQDRLVAELERKSREVMVVCFSCHGEGGGTTKPYREEALEKWVCVACSGTGKMKALLATPINAE